MDRAAHVRRRTETGFTLIEVLVAMVVLSFGLIAITNLMLVAASSNTVANQSTAAATIASQQMEALKALRFTDTQLAAGGDLESDTAYSGYTTVAGVGRIRTRWRIDDIVSSRGSNPSAPAGLKFITVRSEGLGALTGARSRAEFTTFRTENPDPRVTPTPTPGAPTPTPGG